jgi:hypothetical protein
MAAKARLLTGPFALPAAKVVEPRLAYSNHFGQLRSLNQLIKARFMAFSVIGVDPNRGIDLLMLRSQRLHNRKIFPIDADAEQLAYALFTGLCKRTFKPIGMGGHV